MTTQIRPTEWTPTKDFLPLILGKSFDEELNPQELDKVAFFEKGLESELKKNDTIEQALTKIVKMALAAEFGPSLVAAKGAAPMVTKITGAIMSDPLLRKQALLIVDRFAR